MNVLRQNYKEHRQQIFDDYLITKNMEATGQKFGVSRQRVQQIVSKFFHYRKPVKYWPTEEELEKAKFENSKRIFWDMVDVRSDDECWNWKGSVAPSGYPRCNRMGESYAHRVAWLYVCPVIPKGMDILRHCGNQLCCNPHHLYAAVHSIACEHRGGKFAKKNLIEP